MANPIQEYQTARSMPIPALVAVLNGQSDMVSLGVAHAALKEKMEAEVAKKGANAMQMAQSPKVVQKDMAMAQGLASTPADLNVPMGGIVGSEGQMTQTAAGGGSVVAFQAGGLGALNMSGNELKSFIDAMTKKGIPPAQVNQFAQQAQAVASQNPSALRGFLSTAARRFGLPGAMIGFTDALIASEKGGRQVTGATPGYDYASEEAISGIEPGVVGPSTNKSSIDQFVSNIGAIMPSGPGAETREAVALMEARKRAAAANYGQSDTGGVPTQTLASTEAAQARPEAAPAPAGGIGGIGDKATTPGGGIANLVASRPMDYTNIMKSAKDFIKDNYNFDTIDSQTLEQFTEEERAALVKAGYDFNLVREQMAKLAEEKEALKGEKKEAETFRLIEAGLAILGGESPYAFVNIGKGATPALQGLAKDLKDLKKTSRALDKETMQLKLLQNEIAQGTVKNAQARLDKQTDRMERQRQERDRITTDIFRTMTSDETTRYVSNLQRQTSLDVANIGASKVGETMQIIQGMSGNTLGEKVKNYFAAAKGDPLEKARITALYEVATDPVKMRQIQRTNKPLYDQLNALLQSGLASAGMLTEKPGTGPIRK